MRCYLEITGAVLRVYPDDVEYGGPFDLSLFVTGDEGTATLKGLRTDGLTHEHRKAIFACLADHGFTDVEWRRRNANGAVRQLSFKLRKE